MTDYSYDPNSGAAPQPGGFGHAGVSQAQNPSEGLPAGDAAEVQPDPNPAAEVPNSVPESELDPAPAGAALDDAQVPVEQLLSDAGTPEASPAAEENQGQETPNEADNAPVPAEELQQAPEGAAPEDAETELNQLSAEPTASTVEKDYNELLEGNLPDIQKYMDEHPDEVAAIKAAEAGRDKPRKGVTEH